MSGELRHEDILESGMVRKGLVWQDIKALQNLGDEAVHFSGADHGCLRRNF